MQPLDYKSAGVDIEAANTLIEKIKPYAKRTRRPEVLADLGGFGALFDIGKRYRHPVLVSGTDGVGTKLRLAFEWKQHNTVGIDLVAMSVNDILAQGAEPLFFLDYFACGQLDVTQAAQVIEGIAQGCEFANCALIGGETAEMPGMYPAGEYDLAGFAVGVVEKDNIINGHTIVAGDAVIGLAASGAHSNGYSLIRKILAYSKSDLDHPLSKDRRSLRELILTPTRIYVRSVLEVLAKVKIKGLAHITGGGLLGNIPRILPASVKACLHKAAWPLPPLFQWLREEGQLSEQELYRTFNSGIGMVVVVSAADVSRAIKEFEKMGETVYRLGEILPRNAQEEAVEIIE